MSRNVLRRHVSMPGLLSTVRRSFDTITDPVRHRQYSLSDCLMSGLAMFALKCPSLLEFDTKARTHPNEAIVHNLQHLYKVDKTPSDSCLRERLDVIDPTCLRDAFRGVFASLQRGKGLEHFTSLGHYLLSIDGTGYFSSKKVKCASCCTKHHRDGSTTYYHQMLGGALVHPTIKTVFPLAPEMIDNRDGSTKNNCERKAMKRFITSFRENHPHLKTIVLADGLSSNAPTITQLKSHDLRFILGAKPGDHKFLFNWVATSPQTSTLTRKTREKNKTITHHFTWMNTVPLNESNMDLEVNVLHYTEISPEGRERRWSWVSDLTLDSKNVMAVMRAGRTRWRIENEAFQTLKTAGYNFEHNYGHGDTYLANVFSSLCTLAFLLDQITEHCCGLFKQALHKQVRKKYLWAAMVSLFSTVRINSWELFYRLLSEPTKMIDGAALLDEP